MKVLGVKVLGGKRQGGGGGSECQGGECPGGICPDSFVERPRRQTQHAQTYLKLSNLEIFVEIFHTLDQSLSSQNSVCLGLSCLNSNRPPATFQLSKPKSYLRYRTDCPKLIYLQDGIVNDLDSVIEVLAKSGSLPLSIIFVAVGPAQDTILVKSQLCYKTE